MEPAQVLPSDVLRLAAGGIWQLRVGFLLFTLGARYAPAVQFLLLGTIETICAPIWLWLVFGEIPRDPVLLGGGIVLLAVAAQALPGARKKPLGLKPR